MHDTVGPLSAILGGPLVVQIAYSNGSRGTLTVTCHLVGTLDLVFEGVTASMGFVDYRSRQAPPAQPGDATRTNFDVLR